MLQMLKDLSLFKKYSLSVSSFRQPQRVETQSIHVFYSWNSKREALYRVVDNPGNCGD